MTTETTTEIESEPVVSMQELLDDLTKAEEQASRARDEAAEHEKKANELRAEVAPRIAAAQIAKASPVIWPGLYGCLKIWNSGNDSHGIPRIQIAYFKALDRYNLKVM